MHKQNRFRQFLCKSLVQLEKSFTFEDIDIKCSQFLGDFCVAMFAVLDVAAVGSVVDGVALFAHAQFEAGFQGDGLLAQEVFAPAGAPCCAVLQQLKLGPALCNVQTTGPSGGWWCAKIPWTSSVYSGGKVWTSTLYITQTTASPG